MSNEKVFCTECGWHGTAAEIDRVQDPRSPEVWNVCPKCRTPEHIVTACDQPECWQPASCGTPTAEGYRQTCGDHMPNRG